MSIEKIRLDAFRGATKEVAINFDPTKKVTLIFGENGNGKSTIIDGLTFLCNQTKGSLDDRSEAQNRKYLVSSGRSPDELFVEIKTTSTPTPWIAKLSGSQIKVIPDSGYPFLKVLRRAKISKFIDDEPNDKYKEIKEFIETPGIEKSEQALRDCERSIAQELTDLTRDYANAEDQLKSLWDQEGKAGNDYFSWAKSISEQNVDLLKSEKELIEKLKGFSNVFKESLGTLEKELDNETKAKSEYTDALNNLKKEEAKISGQTAELLTVLQLAKSYLENNVGVEKCPVCTQRIKAEDLRSSLAERISSLDNLSRAKVISDEKKKKLDQAKSRVSDRQRAVVTAFESIEAILPKVVLEKEALPQFKSEDLYKVKNSSIKTYERLEAAKSISKVLEPTVTSLCSRLEDIQKNINLQNAVSTQFNSLTQNRKKQQKTNALHERLKEVLKVVEEDRKSFISEVLMDIRGEIRELYRKVHPGEPLDTIDLVLDPKWKNSLHLTSDFIREKGVPPQAYYSESHLDTLGICIWLAFAKKFSPSDALIILDDVLTSVDSPHLDRFIKMLDEIAQSFGHVILTTHYRSWRDRYRTHQDQNSSIHFIELKEWSPERGIISDSCKPSLQEVKDWLDPEKFERQITASKAGIFLEMILDYLTLLYRVSVPRKPSPDYTLGELLDAFPSKKRGLLRVVHLDSQGNSTREKEIGPILNDLNRFTWIRNQVGCHFNLPGQEISDRDVRQFAEKVVELGEAVICQESGDFPRKNKTGSFYQSSSGRCRLYPLQMP